MKITEPDDLTPEDLTLIPNPPTERAATVLLPLLQATAEGLGIDQEQLVQLQGVVLEHGSVGLYGRLPFPGAIEYASVVVGYYRADEETGFSAVDMETLEDATPVYDGLVARLDAA